jgi:hypothetical protein
MSDFETIRTSGSYNYIERRKKEDWMVKAATILSLVAWAFAIAVWFVLEAASPDREMRFITSLTQIHFDSPIYIRQQWDDALLAVAFGLLVAALIICIIAFVFNKMRMRRKTDKYRKSVFILGGTTIVGIVAFIIRFGLLF